MKNLVILLVILVPLALADLCTNPQTISSALTNIPTSSNTTLPNSYYFVYYAPAGHTSVSLKFYPYVSSGVYFGTSTIYVSDACAGSFNYDKRTWAGDNTLVFKPYLSALNTASTLYIAVNSSNPFYIQVCSTGGLSVACKIVCPNDCSSNGHCDVPSQMCSCNLLYGGSDCSSCTGCAAVTTVLFGSIAMCLFVTCVIPIAVVVAIIVAAVCCCSRRSHHHHHHTSVIAHEPLLGGQPAAYYPPQQVYAQPNPYAQNPYPQPNPYGQPNPYAPVAAYPEQPASKI